MGPIEPPEVSIEQAADCKGRRVSEGRGSHGGGRK